MQSTLDTSVVTASTLRDLPWNQPCTGDVPRRTLFCMLDHSTSTGRCVSPRKIAMTGIYTRITVSMLASTGRCVSPRPCGPARPRSTRAGRRRRTGEAGPAGRPAGPAITHIVIAPAGPAITHIVIVPAQPLSTQPRRGAGSGRTIPETRATSMSRTEVKESQPSVNWRGLTRIR
jgi:hypothetical protein